MDIPLTLLYMRPGETWELDGDSYDGLTWRDNTQKPTLAEMEAAWPAAYEAAGFTALRAERTLKLSQCDWTQVADAPVDKKAWADYRQALRDLPDNTTDPYSPEWPTPPA
jgi:hypothetical protein